MKASIQIRNPS